METNSTNFSLQLSAYQDSLRTFAMSFTKDFDDAEDLVQDTMVKAIRYGQQFKEGTNLKSWLYTILKNTFINNYRRNNLSKTLITNGDDISSAQLKLSASENLGEQKCTMDDIQFALKKLQPEYYIPFMKYFEGFKYHEIAEELDIPIGTVKTRIHMARGILKKNLKMYQDQFNQVN